jgi:uncharacterized protein
VLICLSAESREKTDEPAGNAVAAGGTGNDDGQDHGYVYGRSFDDLDGHSWEVLWMDPAAVQG